MKKFIVLLICIIIPINVFALNGYTNKAGDILGVEQEKDIINIYLFHGKECPHCKEEKTWLKKINKKYNKYIKTYYFEVWHDKDNQKLYKKIYKGFEIEKEGVPLTIIGDNYYLGFSDTISSEIENQIKKYANIKDKKDEINLPILGKIDKKKVSLPIVAVILGFIDGFNPCAMWILLFLISMLITLKRKKALILGFIFLFVSGFVYFLSMLGINLVLGIASLNIIKFLIGLIILVLGILNLRKYLITRKEETGCIVIDDTKRKRIINRVKSIIESKSFVLSIAGIMILAVSVNLVELACSLGYPLIFSELLNINNVRGIVKLIYILIYILFYMLDDIIVFTISMVTLSATGISNKYSKACTLISAILMILMGILMLVKPNILMFNF